MTRGHAKRTLAQIKEAERDFDLPEDHRERLSERADELKQQIDDHHDRVVGDAEPPLPHGCDVCGAGPFATVAELREHECETVADGGANVDRAPSTRRQAAILADKMSEDLLRARVDDAREMYELLGDFFEEGSE